MIKLVSFLTQPLACRRLSTNTMEGDNRDSVVKSKRQKLEGSGTVVLKGDSECEREHRKYKNRKEVSLTITLIGQNVRTGRGLEVPLPNSVEGETEAREIKQIVQGPSDNE